MAWSSAVLSADEVSLAAADKPLLVATNVLEDVDASGAMWKTGGSWADGADETHADYPATNAYDRRGEDDTRPNAAAATWYFILKWAAGAGDFDSAFILGHNFGTIGGLTVSIQIADSRDFVTNLQTIATWTPGTSTKRLASLSLKHTGADALRYSTVPYARLKVIKDGTITFTPQVAELVLGRRRQLRHEALRPYSRDDNQSGFSDFIAQGGGRVRNAMFVGAAIRTATWSIANTTEATQITSWRSESGYGTKPFFFVERPATAPTDALFMFQDGGEFRFPNVGPIERQFGVELVEQTPFLTAEA